MHTMANMVEPGLPFYDTAEAADADERPCEQNIPPGLMPALKTSSSRRLIFSP
jgi:hypothetical protein